MRQLLSSLARTCCLPLRAVAVVAALLALAGCAVGPDYRRPAVETPADWRWKTAAPKDHVPRGEWWKIFGDATLDSLQGRALTNNLDLQAAFARVEQARAYARISRADFFPSLTGSGRFTRYHTSANAPSPVGFPVPSFTETQWDVPFDLSYELDLWGRVRRSFESARNLAYGAAAAHQSVLLTLQADVAVNYFSIQSAEAEIDLLRRTIELRKDALGAFEQRLGAGIGGEFEVERARVEVASAEADLQSAQRRRAALFNALAVLCGQAPAAFDTTIRTQQVVLPDIAPELPSSLLERRPDIAEAERELAARLAEIGVAQAAFFPSIRLTANGGYMSGELSDLFEWDSHVWSLGPSVSLPIFAGGRNAANLERARAAYDESVAVYRQKILVAFREVEDSLAALGFLRDEVQARRLAAESATKATKLSYDRYRIGWINFLEVVDSETARLQNEVAAVRAANEQRLATVRLIKALGGGWE